MVATLFDFIGVLISFLSRSTRETLKIFFFIVVIYICFWRPEIVTAIVLKMADEIKSEWVPIVGKLVF